MPPYHIEIREAFTREPSGELINQLVPATFNDYHFPNEVPRIAEYLADLVKRRPSLLMYGFHYT